MACFLAQSKAAREALIFQKIQMPFNGNGLIRGKGEAPRRTPSQTREHEG
jgi:hypothetical protein